MRKSFLLTLFLVASLTLQGKDIDVKSLGAKADGKTKVTAVLQKAIDKVSAAGGGRVVLSGGVFLSGPVELKSGVDLHIEADATLLASPDIEDFPDRTDVRHYDSSAMPRFRNASFIYADEAENIAISGSGTIDVNGQYHIRKIPEDKYKGGWTYERIYPTEKSLPRVVFFAGCRRVSITDVTMQNQPAGWSYWIHDCDYVTFERCRVLADVRYPNNDGIHINCSRDVTVSDCFVEAGDDAIVVRANSRSLKENKTCERVVITNCSLKSWAYAIRLGWTNDGVIRCCTFSNLVISNSWCGIGIQLPRIGKKNDYGREATLVEDMLFSNIIMDKVYQQPITMNLPHEGEVLFEGVRNIHFLNVHSSALRGLYIKGPEDRPFENITFTGCSFKIISPDDMDIPEDMQRRLSKVRPENVRMGDRIEHVKGLVMNDTTFSN